ncbi:PREDICTED: protein starmaker-like isoform X2 [Acropora digitifera]|uniref:protein starmaker-like isoform X2 n=1 Tax=Acropora digitifera TaxID=70779 RepID=UPI00077AA7E8|nr:PREDICTED: protein starmaker-like isoform X2 [Acropora digitifera]
MNCPIQEASSQVEEKEDENENSAVDLHHARNNEFEEGKESSLVEADLPVDEQQDLHGDEYVCNVEDQVGEGEEKESASDHEESGIGEGENKLQEDSSEVFQPEMENEQDAVEETEGTPEVNYTGNDDDLQKGGEFESEEKDQHIVEDQIKEDDGVDEISDEGNEEQGGESKEEEGVKEDEAQQEDEVIQESGAVDEVKSREETFEEGHESKRYQCGANEELGEREENEDLGLEERRSEVEDVDDKAEGVGEEGACSDIEDDTTDQDRMVEKGNDLDETEETSDIADDDLEVVEGTERNDTEDSTGGYGEILEGEEVEMHETDLEVDKSYDPEIVVDLEVEDDLSAQVQDENLAKQLNIDNKCDVENERSGTSTNRRSNLERDDSLSVNVASPTPGMVTFASFESLSETEAYSKENEVSDGEKDEDQKETAQGDSANVTDDQDGLTAASANGPVEELESEECDTQQEVAEMDDLDERNQSDHSAGDDCETNDAISEDEATLDPVPEETGEESDDDKDEETFIVYKRPIGQDEETDLSGRVKELGKMFEGGGPIFPKTATIDKNQADGTPVSVRKFKAMFEQDRYYAEKAREPGRREDSSGPPRGIVKNLRGMFENP